MYQDFKIIDADCHIFEPTTALNERLTTAERALLAELPEVKLTHVAHFDFDSYQVGRIHLDRPLGMTEPIPEPASKLGAGMQVQWKGPQLPSKDSNTDARMRVVDMDLEGVDVAITMPSRIVNFCGISDTVLEQAMYRAYHQWMADYCSPCSDRVKGVLIGNPRDVAGTVADIRRWGNEAWPVAIFMITDKYPPLDHPDLNPIWATAEEYDLAIVLHTFSLTHPYPPGIFDVWDNYFIGRTAAHPWTGMRNMAAFIGGGILDRFPKLRVGIMEAGIGWLPHWTGRLDEHYHVFRHLAPFLERLPSEHVKGPQYFQSFEVWEGARALQFVNDEIGDQCAMFGTDYPHAESWFPQTVAEVATWDLPASAKRKLFWDNAARLYARIGNGH